MLDTNHRHGAHGAYHHAPDSASTDRDPVCGMAVAADSPHAVEHDGRSYRFCSVKCLDKFAADPARYLPARADDVLKDPVCGITVEADSPHVATHEGRKFRFCSAKCHDKFVADPARYLQPPPPAPTEATAAPDTEYTCPMHPEVRQIGPGTCPKCGMALEPVMPGAEEGENPELADFRRRFWWTLPLTIIVTVIAMSGGAFDRLLGPARAWVELVLATPVVLWAGWPFFVAACSRSSTAAPTCGP